MPGKIVWTKVTPEEDAALNGNDTGYLEDMARVTPGGIAKAVTGVVGLPGTLSDLASTGLDYVANKVTGANIHTARSPISGQALDDRITKAVTGSTGYYKPKTTAGKVFETGLGFASGAAAGPGGLAARIATNVAAPAIGTVAAGSMVDAEKHPYLHTMAEVAGAIASGSVANLTRIGAGRIGAAMKAAEEAGDVVALRKFQEMLAKEGMTAESIAAGAMPRARGQTVAEAMGTPGEKMARTLARQEGTTGPTFERIIGQRNTVRAEDFLDEAAQASGFAPHEAKNKIADIIERGQQEAKPLFKAAEEHPPPNFAGKLDRLSAQPDVQQGMRVGIRNEQRLAAARDEAFDPNAYGINDFNAAGDPILGPTPTWKTHFAGKKGLDEALEPFRNPITREIDHTPTSHAIDQLRRSYVDELKLLNPKYGEALEKSADYLSTNAAFKDARDHLLATKLPAADMQKYFNKLSPANQDAYRAGLSDKMQQLVANKQNFRPDVLLTPNIQSKLKIAFGEKKAAQFIKAMDDQTKLMGSGGRIRPGAGSFTFEGIETGKTLDKRLGDVEAASAGAQALANLLSGRLLSGTSGLAKAVVHFAPNVWRTGGLGNEGRNELGKLLAMSPDDLQAAMRALPPKPKVDYVRALRGK